MEHHQLDQLRTELSIKAKNGTDIILSASLVWALIGFIWMLDATAAQKSIYTFYAGVLLLPVAFAFSKILHTQWKVTGNPLDSLGLWLNFAQLFYFPILFLLLGREPELFIAAFAVITGGHFFPYSWYYKTPWYAVFSGLIVAGSAVLAHFLPSAKMHLLPFSVSACLPMLALLLYRDARAKSRHSAHLPG